MPAAASLPQLQYRRVLGIIDLFFLPSRTIEEAWLLINHMGLEQRVAATLILHNYPHMFDLIALKHKQLSASVCENILPWTRLTPDMMLCFYPLAPHSFGSVLIKQGHTIQLKCNLWGNISSGISLAFCCYRHRSKYVVAGECERASATFRLMFWFACNSSHTVRRHNQVLSPSCQSQCSPLNYSGLYILFMTIFSHATWKFAKAGFAGRNRAAKAFHRDRARFHLAHRLGELWDVGFIFCRQALSFIYSQYHVEILNHFFICKNTRAAIWERARSRPAPHVIRVYGELEWCEEQSDTKHFLRSYPGYTPHLTAVIVVVCLILTKVLFKSAHGYIMTWYCVKNVAHFYTSCNMNSKLQHKRYLKGHYVVLEKKCKLRIVMFTILMR